MKKKWLMVICVLLATVILMGCGTNDINNDAEFHASVDKAIEQSWRGGDVEVIFEELFTQYSSRYSANKMEEYVEQRFDQLEEELFSRVDELDNKFEALRVESEDLMAQLENSVDYDTYVTINEKLEENYQQIEEIKDEFTETADVYRMIELYEELVELMQEVVTVLEEAL